MPRPWVKGEPGPLCPHGHPTGVTQLDDGKWVALCIVHTQAEGWMGPLPPECPDSFRPNERAPNEIMDYVDPESD